MVAGTPGGYPDRKQTKLTTTGKHTFSGGRGERDRRRAASHGRAGGFTTRLTQSPRLYVDSTIVR